MDLPSDVWHHDRMIETLIAREMGLSNTQVQRVIALLDEGNTIPFLARYRKEATEGLDEVQLRTLQDHLLRLRKLEDRKKEIHSSLEEQGKLTSELALAIEKADKLSTLEDLYLPFRPKRRTRAMVAREKGLEPLADFFNHPPQEAPLVVAQKFLGADVATAEEALAGARDILAERVAEDPSIRGWARQKTLEEGVLLSKRGKGEDPQEKYTLYYAFEEPLRKIQLHRVLACDRGENEGILKVSIQAPEEQILKRMKLGIPQARLWREEAEQAIEDSWKRLLFPAIERDVRGLLTERAQAHAIAVFAANIKSLLLQPPLKGKVVLGLDPGFRTGCKVVVVDQTGKPLVEGFPIYPHEPQRQWDAAIQKLKDMIQRYAVEIIAIGNGTASRETEQLVAETIKGTATQYLIVSEAGASVYSASDVAREEFPQLDATQRGTISIARRLQDPLAELVKIEPKAIGVGQYQHDLDQKALEQALDGVVEDAVNGVGVNLNTASVPLLTRVAGLNKKVATAILEHREKVGPFQSRTELKKVKGLGDRTFQQCAGFLRIPDGKEPLDNTAIHPESYKPAKQLLSRLGGQSHENLDLEKLSKELELGIPTLQDILDNLEKPGRDPREDLPAPHLRSDVLKLEDLKPGMRLVGTVRNVVDFGAFIDIGVKQDGLVHISELSNRFLKHPLDEVSVGQVVEVEVLEIDSKRNRISLSRKRTLNG